MPLALVFAALPALFAQAQEIVATGPTSGVEVESDASPLTVIERWQADPATIFDAEGIDLAELRYIARPLVVFADSPFDPLFTEQMSLIESEIGNLVARDVIVITDTDPAARSPLRLELRPRGFALVLISKEGRVNQRKPAPWAVREIGRAIDKMPLRQQEIREGG